MILRNIVTRLDSVDVESIPGICPSTGNVDVVVTLGLSSISGREFTPGISPANAVLERAHTSVIAINSRFIVVSF